MRLDGPEGMLKPLLPAPPGPLPLQVAVTLEGENRPRNLSVLIRRVAIIPIASLQAFMVGGAARPALR